MYISDNFDNLKKSIKNDITIVAVSKTRSIEDIKTLYEHGHKVFGENKVQEMVSKWEQLPKDIRWHMIGHIQTNKVKHIVPFVSLIHAVDSIKLMEEIEKRARQHHRNIDCLLQVKIAQEESKFGMNIPQMNTFFKNKKHKEYSHINIIGLMGMATNTTDNEQIAHEFKTLKTIYDQYPEFKILSMGMSGDYHIAIEQGSNMIRIGSKIFGKRK